MPIARWNNPFFWEVLGDFAESVEAGTGVEEVGGRGLFVRPMVMVLSL